MAIWKHLLTFLNVNIFWSCNSWLEIYITEGKILPKCAKIYEQEGSLQHHLLQFKKKKKEKKHQNQKTPKYKELID